MTSPTTSRHTILDKKGASPPSKDSVRRLTFRRWVIPDQIRERGENRADSADSRKEKQREKNCLSTVDNEDAEHVDRVFGLHVIGEPKLVQAQARDPNSTNPTLYLSALRLRHDQH